MTPLLCREREGSPVDEEITKVCPALSLALWGRKMILLVVKCSGLSFRSKESVRSV